MKLIRNVQVRAPEPIGRKDVFVAGSQIAAVADPGLLPEIGEVIDGASLIALPGLVDALTHPCGGGGEGGFANRTAEIDIDTFISAGVTTPVGALGTDSLGRSLEVLYGNVMGLAARGLSAVMYTGAYRVPAPTLTGDIARDLLLVEPVIGVGEVAIADHRGAQPGAEELRRLAADAALGGILKGRGGTVMIHVGDGDSRLNLLHAAIAGSDLPHSVFYPTHINRSHALLDEAADWAKAGGFIDITASTTPELIAAGDIPAEAALARLLDMGTPVDKITLSSDAGGSLPVYEQGVLKGLTAAKPAVLMALLAELFTRSSPLYDIALAAVTTNPANALKLDDRGRIAPGGRGDLVLVDAVSHEIQHVLGSGEWLMRDGGSLVPRIS